MSTSSITPQQRKNAQALLRGSLSPGQRLREKLIELGLRACALFSIAITLAIAYVVIAGSIEFFVMDDQHIKEKVVVDGKEVLRERTVYRQMTWDEIRQRVVYFFTGTEWSEFLRPGDDRRYFGILPLMVGTLMVALIAGLIALPIGLMTAIYLSEYASPRVRAYAKPSLELLAGIPTIVFGFFAVTMVTPFLVQWIPGLGNPYNQIAGGFVVGIMIIPTVASLSEDALRAVPRSLRDGAIALGANKFETSVKVVLPAALSGVVASFLLALSRAIGETMAVSLACGNRAELNFDPRYGIATMTSYIVRRAQGDVARETTDFNSLFAVAGVLFFMTLFMNILAQKVLRRYRQVYQ